MIVETEIVLEKDGVEYYWLAVGYFSKYIPAKTTGKPENCYPAEGGELEKVEISLKHVDRTLGNRHSLHYHYCHPQRPTDEQVQVALWEQYDKKRRNDTI